MFVSVPDGYRTVGPFWRRVSDTTSTVDFPLPPIARSPAFTFIHASDTHVAPAVLARTQRFRALADSLNPAFVIITGDLVRDALRVGEAEATGYYELFGREAALFKRPVWTVPGNHENFGIERGQSPVSAALRTHCHVLALAGHIHAGEHTEYEADVSRPASTRLRRSSARRRRLGYSSPRVSRCTQFALG